VTGGAGFIGSNLVDSLAAEGGWNITVVDDLNNFYSPLINQ
jgi:nucleoside-diphosphate-sugar epimerase